MATTTQIATRLDRALRNAGFAIIGVSIGNPADRTTWLVYPPNLQALAQATIDAFNPDDQAAIDADLDEQVKLAVDQERLISAVVWTILDTYAEFKPATIAKYTAARTKIIAAYKLTPWKP